MFPFNSMICLSKIILLLYTLWVGVAAIESYGAFGGLFNEGSLDNEGTLSLIQSWSKMLLRLD